MTASLDKSNQSMWAPFRMEPWFAARPWGSRDLRPWYDRVAEGEPIGEAWLTGDQCLIATGAHAGRSLGEVFTSFPAEMLNSSAECSSSPLLIKVLFAQEKLSVQVHPDDTMAQKYGFPRGKTECWHVLAAEPGAQLALGFKPGVTLERVRSGIADGTLEESLQAVAVQRGETVLVDAGTVHAIWPGSVLLETQQNCDLTYRMFDYGRPRELHVEKSLEAVRFETRAGKVRPRPCPGGTVLVDDAYFRLERLVIKGALTGESLAAGDNGEQRLQYLFVAGGKARLSGDSFEPVEIATAGIAVVPAASPRFTVEDLGGLELIRITPRGESRASAL